MEELAKQSGKAVQSDVDIYNMIEKVKLKHISYDILRKRLSGIVHNQRHQILLTQVKEMQDKARTAEVCKKINHIKLKFSEGNWEDVLNLAGDVIPQLEKLAKQLEQKTEARTDIFSMLEMVRLCVSIKKKHLTKHTKEYDFVADTNIF